VVAEALAAPIAVIARAVITAKPIIFEKNITFPPVHAPVPRRLEYEERRIAQERLSQEHMSI
jgi:hypothetical protein